MRESYRNPSGSSGIRAYEVGPEFIRVWWEDEEGFEYNYETVGRVHVEEMKRLAKRGSHLNAYINRHAEVRSGFVRITLEG